MRVLLRSLEHLALGLLLRLGILLLRFRLFLLKLGDRFRLGISVLRLSLSAYTRAQDPQQQKQHGALHGLHNDSLFILPPMFIQALLNMER